MIHNSETSDSTLFCLDMTCGYYIFMQVIRDANYQSYPKLRFGQPS